MYGDDDLSLTSMPLVDEKCRRRRADSTRAGASLMGSTANSGAVQGEQVGQTVVSETHVANLRLYLVVGLCPGLQDTSRVGQSNNLTVELFCVRDPHLHLACQSFPHSLLVIRAPCVLEVPPCCRTAQCHFAAPV